MARAPLRTTRQIAAKFARWRRAVWRGFSSILIATFFARPIPDGLLTRSAAFRGGVVFQAGTRRRKSVCRCLFARKTNVAKTGYSQTHGAKIISVGERR